VHLVGFIIRIYHDARSPERQIYPVTCQCWHSSEKEVQLYLFSTSALVEGGWSSPCPDCFTPGEQRRHPLHRKLSGPQGRSGPVLKISPPPASRSEVVIRLRYLGPHTNSAEKKFRLIIVKNKRFRLFSYVRKKTGECLITFASVEC